MPIIAVNSGCANGENTPRSTKVNPAAKKPVVRLCSWPARKARPKYRTFSVNAKPTAGQPGQHDAVDHPVELAPAEQQHQQHRRALGGLLDPRRDQHRGHVHPAAAAGPGDRDQARGVEHARRPARPPSRPRRRRTAAGRAAPARSGPASGRRRSRPAAGAAPARCPIRKPTTPVSWVTDPRMSSPQAPISSTRKPISSTRCSRLHCSERIHRASLASGPATAAISPGPAGLVRETLGQRLARMGAGTRQGTSAPIHLGTTSPRAASVRPCRAPSPPGRPRSTPAASPS